MPNAHIAYRVDHDTLIKHPEQVLQNMSFKILEKRSLVLEGLLNSKIQFRTTHGIEQGICQQISSNCCHIKVGSTIVKVHINKLIL